jgi:hypothetical protein
MDVIGSYQIGLRSYLPEAGAWTSPDSLGHDASDNLLSFANSDPVNFFDSDGRVGIHTYQNPQLAALSDYYAQTGSSFSSRLHEIIERAGGHWEPPEQRSFASRFWDQAFMGDYAQQDNGVAGVLGQTAMGAAPVAGQIGDFRDWTAAANDLRTQGWNWQTGAGIVLSTAAWIPVVGDAAKGILKPVLKHADDVPVPHLPHADPPHAPHGGGGTPPSVPSAPPTGTGPYTEVGGHHVHAQSGFRGHPQYDPNQGFSISQELMESRGWNHSDMTATQRRLFNELSESGSANTLQEHTRIAVEALKAGGATEAQARQLVAESLRNLRNQGVTQPTRIPWNTPN